MSIGAGTATATRGARSEARHFAGWSFDPTDGRLARGRVEVYLRPKTAGVLRTLVDAAGEVVAKRDLLEAVWGTSATGDDVLAVCVNELRRILGDDSRHPRFIATAHRRGYRFVAAVSEAPSARGSVGRLLLGREPESAELRRWWAEVHAGRRIVGFVAGESGVGRTSLVRAFADEVQAGGDAYVGVGRCVGHRAGGEPYSPFLDALDAVCRGPGGRRARDVLWQHAPTWLLLLPGLLDDDEAVRLRDRAGAPEDGRFERMLREFSDALAELANAAPVLLVFDDLHAGDTATVGLIASLAAGGAGDRVLVLATYRDPDGPAGARIASVVRDLEWHGAARVMTLAAFDESAVRAYLTYRLGGMPDPETVAEFAERSRGNPLELARLLDHRAR
ncbi:AAA family ATPase [Agromyces bracchium]|uniref:AAA family ATPase n=1 Tax=Agromyces bracchium TaxID=88376 RepID=A0A6I3M4A6_9MICO|nr:AAA family ATPase [Agromyces bracchium]MTH68145.1 AAA family ATPase [Agromyces bracchium]